MRLVIMWMLFLLEDACDDRKLLLFASSLKRITRESLALLATILWRCPRRANSSRCTKRSHICNRWPLAGAPAAVLMHPRQGADRMGDLRANGLGRRGVLNKKKRRHDRAVVVPGDGDPCPRCACRCKSASAAI